MDILLDDFNYFLPTERIAQTPAMKRDASRLMVLSRQEEGSPIHTCFDHFVDFIEEDDLLVMNDTRVIPARISATKETGGHVELLFLHQMPSKDPLRECWQVIAKASRPLRPGSRLMLTDASEVEVLENLGEGQFLVCLSDNVNGIDFLNQHGVLPLPPYIDSAKFEEHSERYQTVYASNSGAVAAPTAGLHFTKQILGKVKSKGAKIAFLTLHVGAGTFLPVRCERVSDHDMHTEFYEIPKETCEAFEQTRRNKKKVIAIGTTSLRALEASFSKYNCLKPGKEQTNIFIYPGYAFQAVDGLLTNFHLPCSTLLMLVSAFYGRERTLAAYHEAIRMEYRFYSYGDAMLVL